MRRHGKPAQLEQIRMVAARMFELDADAADVAAAVDRDDQTVRRWRREWKAGGVAALAAKPHPGPEPQLDDGQWRRILSMLERTPAEHGFKSAYLWTAELIGKLIERTFGVGFSHDYVGIMLRRYRWSPQRPAKSPVKKTPRRSGGGPTGRGRTWRPGRGPTTRSLCSPTRRASA